jgi:hypothetical protein
MADVTAKEVSRTFDHDAGAVYVGIEDQFGKQTQHTVYVALVADVDAEIAQRIAEVTADAAAIRTKMIAAGWTP